jgi:hypothetical protein
MKSRQQDANIHFMGEFIMSIRRLLATLLMGMFPVTVQTSIADEPPSESDAAPSYRVFVVSHTHSDLCWPNSIEACLDANVAAIAKSVEIAEREPSYRFTMEHAIFLREYLRRYPDKQDVVKRLMQSGAIEIGAFYTGPWELTCGGEGLVRQLYLGKRWIKEHLGVDALYVWNVDVAGHTAQMPQILRKAGIEGLAISAGATDNTFEQPYVLHETRGPFLFRWQSPDGSIVPTWSTPWGYGAGEIMGLRKNDLKEFAQKLPTFLEDIRKNHSAHGLPKIAFLTDGTDIQSPSSQVDANIQKWNETKRLPPMTHASTAELFAAVAKESLPTYPGEMPSPWDSMQAQGNECFMLDRRLEGRLLAAEKAASLASLLTPAFTYPHNTFTKIWENRLFAVEHNWGGNKGEISDRQKTDKIEEACRWNDGNLQTALDAVAAAKRAISLRLSGSGSTPEANVLSMTVNRPRRLASSAIAGRSTSLSRGFEGLSIQIIRVFGRIAEWLESQSDIIRVIYPGLKSHPQHDLARRQMGAFGGMISAVVAGGLERSRRFLECCRIFTLAESLGGVESLIEHPALMTHASIPPQQRAAIGIEDGLVRISVGIEHVDDLIADLDQALQQSAGK